MKKRPDGGRQGIMKELRAAGVAAAMVAVVVLAGGPAYAGQNANASLSVSPSVVPAGGTVRITGFVSNQNCAQSSPARVIGLDTLFPPDGFGPLAPRDSHGAFALTYTVPTSTPPGTYHIGARCGGGPIGAGARLTVTAAPLGAPATGAGGTAHSSSLPWTVVGAGCLLVAGVLVALRRRLAGRAS